MGAAYCIILTLFWHCSSAQFPFLEDAANIPPSSAEVYDYIVVGGGTAGSPLAATLSQKYKVLVLERGGSPSGNPNITRRDLFAANLADNGPDAPAQHFVSTDGVPNARARVLGGGTCINGGFYSRAESCFVSLLGLDERLVEESYEWVENVIVSIPQQLGPYQSVFRTSLLQAGVAPDNGATYDHFIGTKTGGTIFDELGNRRPASDLLVYADPLNVTVLLRATVQRILFTDQATAAPKAYGVVYRDRLGQNRTALLSNGTHSEIIVCAGTLGSPQLLMLSGIGPPSHLEEKGIEVLVDAPEVGKHMADNPATFTSIPSPAFVESSLTLVVGITSFGSYIESASGMALVPNAPQTGVILQKANGPFSSGELYLNTREASDNPIITFNYFRNPRDLQVCVGGVDQVEEVILADSYKPFRYDNQSLPSGGTVSSPDRRNPSISRTMINTTLAEYCRNNLATVYHSHGGCLMNKVVDIEYKVIGTGNLRVVDSSTFVISPGTNPQATLLMLGRYMGLKIIEERE